MPLQRTMTPVLLALPDSLPRIFDQVQVSTANHQKNFVALNKIHSAAIQVTETSKNGVDLQLTGEKAFEDIFIDMVIRILPLKKGATVVDRVVKFVAGYVKFISDKERQAEDFNEDEETPITRFVLRLVSHILKGVEAKDKNVRFRVVQILREVITSLRVVDNSVRNLLKGPLIDRSHDKEAPVRTQAVIALCTLLRADDDGDEDDDDEGKAAFEEELLPILLEALEYDDSADVRRAILQHISLSERTLRLIVARCRDIDASVRRTVFTTILEKLESPKQLTIGQREKLVSSGVTDRDPTVSSATQKLIGAWVDTCENVVDFVELFDFELIIDESDTRPNPAQQALYALFGSRKDVLDGIEFGDDFWKTITISKAFLARAFVQFCADAGDDERIESSIPVMTHMAFMLQTLHNNIMNDISAAQEARTFGAEEDAAEEKEASDKQFILKQLMRLSLHLDYADEIGRRKLFQLIRSMIAQESLPDSLVPLCLDILRKLNTDEKDLIRIVVEVIHDLRDNDTEDDFVRGKSMDATFDEDPEGTPIPPRTPGRPRKPTHEMTDDERERADAIDVRCLALCIGMLERVNSSFEDNSTLEGIFGELIIPAVKRKELPLRERGFISLGLCCLIARRMASNSFQLFLQQYNPSPNSLRLRILQIVFDIMMAYESDFLGNSAVGGDRVIEFLTKLFESADDDGIQAVLCKGLAKLMMSGMVTDEKVLRSLVLAYVSPDTAENQEVRQCLSYFFPVYCYSSAENQRRMSKIFLSSFKEISDLHKDLEEEEDMVTPAQAALLLVDWTDPQKIQSVAGRKTDPLIHFDIAFDVTKALLGKDFDREDRKVLCQLFSKLYLPEDVDENKVRTLKLLVDTVRSRRPFKDTTSSAAMTRFNKLLEATYEQQLSSLTEDELHHLEEQEEVKEVFDILDNLVEEDGEEEQRLKRGARKRRSESVVSEVSTQGADEDEYHGASAPKIRKGRANAKRVSKSDDEASDETTSAPKRELPKRSARKAAIVVQPLPSLDENEVPTEVEESESEDEDITPPPRAKKTQTTPRRFGSKQKIVADGDEDLPDEFAFSQADVTFEAADADDDDEEVADLLGEMEV